MKFFLTFKTQSFFKLIILFAYALSVESNCLNSVSIGDQHVGIGAFYDPTCSIGGIGCFANNCRFCHTKKTIQSGHFIKCPSKTVTSKPTASPTPPPTATPTPSPVNSIDCPSLVSQGDQNSGLSAFYDAVCSTIGGVGCFPKQKPCRFCKTPSNKNIGSPFLDCKKTPKVNCEAEARKANKADVSAINNKDCTETVGCFPNGLPCQYCRIKKNEDNQYLISCKVLQDRQIETNGIDCLNLVTKDQQNRYLSAYYDKLCLIIGGVGCFENRLPCRLCRTPKASSSEKNYLTCKAN